MILRTERGNQRAGRDASGPIVELSVGHDEIPTVIAPEELFVVPEEILQVVVRVLVESQVLIQLIGQGGPLIGGKDFGRKGQGFSVQVVGGQCHLPILSVDDGQIGDRIEDGNVVLQRK